MRIRSNWALPTIILSSLGLALPLAAQAASPPAPVTSRQASSVTLITGERVRLAGAATGTSRPLIQRATRSGPGSAVITRRLGSQLYVMPAVAEPYLTRFLDPSLFDVTALSAGLRSDGRLPVRISYTGAKPAAPGVTITSASGGSATGYLTPSSAATFGAALVTQWKADSAAKWPARSTLFTGVTKISASAAVAPGVQPNFPMFTLIIKAVEPDGTPQADGFVALLNVDDARKYNGFAEIVDGQARVSVPAGNYSAIGDDFGYDEATNVSTIRVTTVNEYRVSGANQTLTIDHRRATAAPSVSVPKPAALSGYDFEWDRTDAAGMGGLGSGYGIGGSDRFLVSPSGPAKLGAIFASQTWNLAQPVDNPAYTYDLAAGDNKIPSNLHRSFTAADLGTVHSAYFTDGPTRDSAFIRYPIFAAAFGGGGFYAPLSTPKRRTEYAGALGAAVTWGEAYLFNNDSFDDPGFVDSTDRVIPAGSSSSREWLRGPLGAGIPTQSTSPSSFGFCYACRTADTLDFALAPLTDSDPGHSGEIFGALDGLPVTRFRFYENGTLVRDEDDFLGDEFLDVPAARTTYKAILDIDRRLTGSLQSTRSNTQVTFASAANQGGTAAANWYCIADTGSGCRVLPVLLARLSLPTTLRGQLPAGRSRITVTAAQIQGATRSAITSASLQVRPAGYAWQTVPLTPDGAGRYTGVIDSTDFAGSDVDVQVNAADAAGSTYQQTVLKAYTVAGS